MNIEQERKASAVPLAEQLRSIPEDWILRIDTPNALGCMDTRSIPVGRLCHEAAASLAPAPAGEPPQPVAWMESPHGAIRANPAYKLTAPQSISWSIPLYAAPTQLATRDAKTLLRYRMMPGESMDQHPRGEWVLYTDVLAHLAQPVQAQRAEEADAGVSASAVEHETAKGTAA